MSHAMRSTLQSQNVLVELTHKHAHTCLDLTDPSSIWWTSTHCHHSHSVERCNPMAIPSAGLHGSDYWNSVSLLRKNNSKKKKTLSSGMALIRTQACWLLWTKGITTHPDWNIQACWGWISSLTVPECWAKFKPVLALSHCLRPPSQMVPSSSNDNPTMCWNI